MIFGRVLDFEGLEIPLAQVNYWIGQLQILKDLELKANVNQERQEKIRHDVLFLLKNYHDNYARDREAGDLPRAFVFPEESLLIELVETQREKDKKRKKLTVPVRDVTEQSLIEQIQNAFSADFIYIKKEFVLYSILREFFPELNDVGFVYGKEVGRGCFYSENALFPVLSDEAPYYQKGIPSFPAILAPIKENCRPHFSEKEGLIYATVMSLYKSLDRYYRYLAVLIQQQHLDKAFSH